ncbi:hypothetical protein [Streptomyces gobitricini]|uniref:hypothetical protein n=1 Tax=Streptomyces gobitricini TaxID=68211 RepID=UPI0031D2BACE
MTNVAKLPWSTERITTGCVGEEISSRTSGPTAASSAPRSTSGSNAMRSGGLLQMARSVVLSPLGGR